MSGPLIMRCFPDAWTFVADLDPDVRTMRLIWSAHPTIVHEIVLRPEDATSLDLGHSEPGLYWDERGRPIVFLMDRHGGGALIWCCSRGETYRLDATRSDAGARGSAA